MKNKVTLHQFHHDGVNLTYADNGGDGPPLVFQHGLTGNHDQIRMAYRNKRRRVVTLNCRGHGGSDLGPPEKIGLAVFTEDLRALLDHLGVTQAAFAGISMGAAMAFRFASLHPERVERLVLIRPSWYLHRCPGNMALFLVMADFLQHYGKERGKEFFRDSDAYRELERDSPDNAASLLDIFDKGDPAETVHLLRRVTLSNPGFDPEGVVARGLPVRVVGTAMDVAHPEGLAKDLAAALHGEYVAIVPKSEDKKLHAVQLTEAVDGFLDGPAAQHA